MAAATAAMRRLDIDLCQRAHDDEAEGDERDAREQCVAKRSRLEQHADVVGPDEKQPECYEYRQTAQDIRAHALRGGQRLDVALDAQSLTDRLATRRDRSRGPRGERPIWWGLRRRWQHVRALGGGCDLNAPSSREAQ